MSASTPASNYSPGKAALPVEHKWLLTVAVMGASIIQILDSTIANVAIPHMQTSLGATIDSVTWVLTSYILASAVAMPAAGWLSDRVGSRRLFLLAVAGFIVTSMLCGIATSLTQMVLFRILQGICAAFIGPLSQTILLDINPPEKAPRAMQVWGMGIMIAPIFGPMIGGWLTESYNWRWVFYINLPIGIPTLALLWWLLPSPWWSTETYANFLPPMMPKQGMPCEVTSSASGCDMARSRTFATSHSGLVSRATYSART